jgi:hypothetical protein
MLIIWQVFFINEHFFINLINYKQFKIKNYGNIN